LYEKLLQLQNEIDQLKKSIQSQINENSLKKSRRILDCPMFGVDV
jgi:regulator of replication initiation timing